MVAIEMQIRKQVFLGALKDEINRQRLPIPTFPPLLVVVYPSLGDASLQRIECVECTLDPSDGDGQVTVQARLVFHHSRLPEVKAAGSLQIPVMREHRQTLLVELSVLFVAHSAPPGQSQMPSRPTLRWSDSIGLLAGSAPIDVPGSTPGSGAEVVVGAIEANDSVVALRLGTSAADPVKGPIQDRLMRDDWSFAVPGQIFADALAASLHEVLHKKLPEGIVLSQDASGEWYPPVGIPGSGSFPGAIASATLHVQHKCIFGIVIPVDLFLSMTLQASGHSLVQTVTLSWKSRSTLCDLVGGALFFPILPLIIDELVSSAISHKILGGALGSPQGFKEVSRDDSSITYQQKTFLESPIPRGVMTQSQVNQDGLWIGGTMERLTPPLGLQGEVTEPRSGLTVDCHHRSVSVNSFPPEVTLRDIRISGGAPRLFTGRVWFEPPNAWEVVTGPSNTWLDLSLTFADPPQGRLPAGTATSVYLHTDCGLRWVDLGVIPADHPAATMADTGRMISQCMAISDPWGSGVLNLEWLVDPPFIERGLGVVRQWSLGFRDLPESARLEFIALGVEGAERSLGVVEDHQFAAVELVTDADETLQIRSGEAFSAPAPLIIQRWLIPSMAVPVGGGLEMISSSGGMIGLRDRDGQIRLIDAGPDGRSRVRLADSRMSIDPAFRRLKDAIEVEVRRGLGIWAVATQISEGMVAVYRGNLLICGVGPSLRL
jgi:hypothetical protein